jgi:hypothetical protein
MVWNDEPEWLLLPDGTLVLIGITATTIRTRLKTEKTFASRSLNLLFHPMQYVADDRPAGLFRLGTAATDPVSE